MFFLGAGNGPPREWPRTPGAPRDRSQREPSDQALPACTFPTPGRQTITRSFPAIWEAWTGHVLLPGLNDTKKWIRNVGVLGGEKLETRPAREGRLLKDYQTHSQSSRFLGIVVSQYFREKAVQSRKGNPLVIFRRRRRNRPDYQQRMRARRAAGAGFC